MRHLAGVGGEKSAHRLAGIAGQCVAFFLRDAVVAHSQVIHAAGFLQLGQRGQEIFRLVGILHPHGTRHLDELSVADVAFHEKAVELVGNHNQPRAVRQVVVVSAHGVLHRMFGGSAGELHRQSGNGAAVGHAFAGFDVASVFYRTGQVFGDVPDGRQRYRLAQYVHETANHYFRIVKQGGEYKKFPNEVGGRDTALPEEVADKMKALLTEYNAKEEKTFEDILDFHVKFERIHPFQDGNGRVGRLIMFKECLKYNIVPFIIEDDLKMFYYRGLKEWDNEKGYLTDTCLTAQDKYKAYLDYFRIVY